PQLPTVSGLGGATFREPSRNVEQTRRRGGDSNSRGLSTLAVFKTAAFNRARPPLPTGAQPLTRDGARAKGRMRARTAPAVAGAGLNDARTLPTMRRCGR